MGAFAHVTMPLDLSRRSAAAIVAAGLVETFPGTRNVALDAGAQTVSFEMQFPGNLSDLISRLQSNSIPIGARAEVSIPVRNLAPEIGGADPQTFAHRLAEGPEVWDAQFDRGRYVFAAQLNGDRVEASIAPSSTSMHELYDALLTLGFVAFDGGPSSLGV